MMSCLLNMETLVSISRVAFHDQDCTEQTHGYENERIQKIMEMCFQLTVNRTKWKRHANVTLDE